MTSPKALLRAWNLRPKKKLGQHFLVDPSTADMIARHSRISSADMVIEIGAGFGVKDMTGYENNDQMRAVDGKVVFESNNAGGITGGVSTGQPIIARLAVKPTPTIDKPHNTIDKYTLETTDLAAITRRDPTIVARIWPVAENYTSIVLLDHLMMHYGYQMLKGKMA